MKIDKDAIIFKSLPDLFADEYDGVKPNTVRLLDEREAEEVNNKWGFKYIKIVKSTDEQCNFIRELTNITDITDALQLKLPNHQRLFVFSWEHPTEEREESFYEE